MNVKIIRLLNLKRPWPALLGVLLLAAPRAAQAQDTYSTNTDGSVYTYSINADGNVTIVAYSGPPWAVTIPTNINGLSVTSIGDDAFDQTSLTSVIIPGSVTNIGDGAFKQTSLTNISIPGSVTRIGSSAFFMCLQLTSLSISNGVGNIGDNAFAFCSGLRSIAIPSSVTNIGSQALYDCQNLTAITVDAQSMSYSSVSGVLINKTESMLVQYPEGLGGSYTIPDSVASIADYAFDSCYGLTAVTIPSSVTTIGVNAFFACDSLTNAAIAEGITNIGMYAFADCYNLTAMIIPGSVTSIGDFAFYNCSDLTNVTMGKGVMSIGGLAFCYCYSITSLTLGESVTNIGYAAFFDCSGLTSLMIPASVTSIGGFAFTDCSSLKSVFFSGNAPTPAAAMAPFFTDNATAYYLMGTTGWAAFSSNAELPSILWNPIIQTGNSNFGLSNNQFGFNITGTTNIPIVVEACTNLATPLWIPLQTLNLTNGSYYFSEAFRTNNSGRFYRISSP